MKRIHRLRNISITLLAAIVLSSVVLAPEADARPSRKGGVKRGGFNQQQEGRAGRYNRGKGDMGLMRLLAGVDLSDEQKAQAQEKFRAFQLATEESRLKLRFVKQDLRDAMRQEPVDQAKVDALWDEITRLRNAQDDVQTNQLAELKRILTEEQLATLQARERSRQELHALKAEYREVLLASGATDIAKLQELQAKITEKQLAFEKERAQRRAAFQNDFARDPQKGEKPGS